MLYNPKTPSAHGGDIYRYREAAGSRPLIDFSANTNPLGLPCGVIRALRGSAEQFDRYPDPHCRGLRAALADFHGIDAERIVCGNGAADLIYRLACLVKPKHALLTAPTFSEYAKALAESGCGYIEAAPLKPPSFYSDGSILARIFEETEILFLCSPNNPTGHTVPEDLLWAIVERCAQNNVLLVVDECFNGFLDDPPAHSAVSLLGQYPRLAVLNAFTKTYAMAGLRLGYLLCGGQDIAENIAALGQAWSVSGPAQIAGLAALGEGEYLERSRRLIKEERRFLKSGLADLGIEVLGGEANFIFFRVNEENGFAPAAFFADLLEQGILVRSCANYPGLDNSYYRIAVKKRTENRKLIAALKTIRGRA